MGLTQGNMQNHHTAHHQANSADLNAKPLRQGGRDGPILLDIQTRRTHTHDNTMDASHLWSTESMSDCCKIFTESTGPPGACHMHTANTNGFAGLGSTQRHNPSLAATMPVRMRSDTHNPPQGHAIFIFFHVFHFPGDFARDAFACSLVSR
eukprot:TRINITY_DN18200_c0_g1_i1.p1 TRINITY_DN18200_c0_g1~~TRINITY_DN18200_c0_g1_i1.p1  ORF type:complete len:151 (-),score=8.05 TRINITY_DN18200_c0_g1_i1:44-496(-)